VASREKPGQPPLRCRAVRSLQSRLSSKYREKLGCFACFGGRGGGISLQSSLRGGERGIRTVGTALNGARADVCVSYRNSILYPEKGNGWCCDTMANQCGFRRRRTRRRDALHCDRLRVGSAILMVTQPHMPCYKLPLRFERDDMIKRFLTSRRSGFYFAVVEEGEVHAGSEVEF
jgi:hypothetical protein